jgi:hypothetical protein
VNIRIDNIGAQPPTYFGKSPEDAGNTLAIVEFFPNPRYGKMQELLDDGWEDDGSFVKRNGCGIDKKCFENKENNIVVAYLTYCIKEGATHLETVGERVLNLSPEDRETFFEVYAIAAKRLTTQCKEREREKFEGELY